MLGLINNNIYCDVVCPPIYSLLEHMCSTNVQDLNHERLAAGQAAPSPPGPSQPFAAQFTPLPPSMRAGKRKGQRVVIHRIKLQSATVPSAPRFCDSFAITNLY